MPDRILVVANETCPGAELHRAVVQLAGGKPSEVMVIAPAVNGWLQTWATDVDGAIEQAHQRVDAAVKALRDEGLQATGDVGDGNPLVAIEDALRIFDAEAIVVSTHPPGPLALAVARPRRQGAEALRAARHARRRRPRARHRRGAARGRRERERAARLGRLAELGDAALQHADQRLHDRRVEVRARPTAAARRWPACRSIARR